MKELFMDPLTAEITQNIRTAQERVQRDLVSRIAELLEKKRPPRGMDRAEIEEWIMENLPDSKLGS